MDATNDLKSRIAYLEENRRYIQNAMEMALSLGDFQEAVSRNCPPEMILQETEKRIRQLIRFEARAFYLVDPDCWDIVLSLCKPDAYTGPIEKEIDFMINEGLVAWAIRERRGVSMLSQERDRTVLLHVIATHARIQGLFVGLFPSRTADVPDVSLDLLSIILRHAANAIESVAYNQLREGQKRMLEQEVDQKAKALLRFEQRLRRAQKMEAIGTLAGGVAHDLNNILTGIVSYPDLILMKLPADSPLRPSVQTIKETGKKAAAIVQDLLTLARRGVSVTEVVNLNDIITEYLKSPEFAKLQMYHPKVAVTTDLEPDLLNILGSPFHLSKTVMNMVSNAAEAMPEGGELILCTKNRHVDRPVKNGEEIAAGDYALLKISDTGIGISAEDMERIFEPFYTKKIMGRSGTGLGMAVVWGTVKDHKGFIDVRSTEGRGSDFCLYFPATRRAPANPQPCLNHENYRGCGETILVVDDIREQRQIAKLILSELGYAVTTASGGEAAVDTMIQHGSFDLLILDMIMEPGPDGLATYRKILRHFPGQRAIIASGYSETSRVRTMKKLGAGHYLKKPYTINKLGAAVRAELDRPAGYGR